MNGSVGLKGSREDGTSADLNATGDDSSKVLFMYFSLGLSKGRYVSSMTWSVIDPDFLAEGSS